MSAAAQRRESLPEFCFNKAAGGLAVYNVQPPHIPPLPVPRNFRRVHNDAAAVKRGGGAASIDQSPRFRPNDASTHPSERTSAIRQAV